MIDDVYISKKIRSFTKDCFGFVRFRKADDALNAISMMNGYLVKGRKFKVSMAKYNKSGTPINIINAIGKKQENRRILKPSFRGERTYYKALMREKPRVSSEKSSPNIISVKFTLSVEENIDTAKMLQNAVIAENTEAINLAHTATAVSAASASVKGMFSLSPTKILLAFDCEKDVEYAMREGSELWNIFDDIRKWSEGELFDDRLV